VTIHFGTDGWRAVISDTFTFHNLRLVAQAIADAVASAEWLNGSVFGAAPDPHKMVVGFDTRFLSDRYAAEAARVLAANGFSVFLSNSDVPTPAVSLAVRQLGAIGGIMITASHNAPRYNGVKLKAAYGGSALPEQCRRVEVYLNDNEQRGRGPNLMDYDRAKEAGLIQRFNPTLAYFDHLRSLIDFQAIAENPQHLVVDPMFGSGRGQIRGILQGTGCEVFEIRGEMNPGFGGIHPEPIARYLGPLAGAIAAGHGQLGLATDGDADRIGAMDGRGQFVDPHRILALALKYLVEQRGWRGKVVKTISTTQMINRLAARYGLEVVETPVGFNHIADWMLRDPVLIGGEESGGMSFRGHIPEGDGVLMGLLLVEMVATTRTPLEDLVAQLLAEAGPSHYARLDLRLSAPVAKDRLVAHLTDEPPTHIAGTPLASVSTLDGVKYLLEDESWLLIRPSGTEPVLRIYAEAREARMVEQLLAHGRAVAEAKH
jgi:alpha-D-glucose phosphate-specific phosphoglucomutase